MSSLKKTKHFKKLNKLREFNRDTAVKRALKRDFQAKKLREEMNEVSQEGLDVLEVGELSGVEIQSTVANMMNL